MIKVQGDWCRGCTVDCTYRKEPWWTGESKASLVDFETFLENIENVINKVVDILQNELFQAN